LGVVINDIGPEIDQAGLSRIAGYVGARKSTRTWDDAIAAIKALDGAIFPEYSDSDWQRMARRRFVEMPDGTLRPDYDPNISKPFEGATKAINLWPFFMALKGMPALAIRGEHTDILAESVFSRMKRTVPSLRQVTVPGRGHAPTLSEPVAREAIDEFLASLPSSLGLLTTTRRSLAAVLLATRLKARGLL
ncbi:MAG: alpha/beta hydrolase, partial [Rhodospirillaceae bacterium]